MSFFSKIGDVLSAPFKVVGSVLGIDSDDGTEAAQRDYEISKQSAQDQMAFQERMSNSAYQRAVKDLREAGLNPLMAALQGGASTPSGASYGSNFVAGKQTDISKDQLQMQRFSSWLSSAQGISTLNNTNASTAQIKANTNLANAQAQYTNSQNAVSVQSLKNLTAEFDNIVKQGKLTDAQIAKIGKEIDTLGGQIGSGKAQAAFYDTLEEYPTLQKLWGFGQALSGSSFGNSLSSLGSAVASKVFPFGR